MGDGFKITMAAARKNAGKNQSEVAKALHVARQTIIAWEKGKRSPTVKKAQEFCEFCNVPFDRVTFLREKSAI